MWDPKKFVSVSSFSARDTRVGTSTSPNGPREPVDRSRNNIGSKYAKVLVNILIGKGGFAVSLIYWLLSPHHHIGRVLTLCESLRLN